MASTGGCLCGAVRFEAEGASPDVHACHCGMCRRWSGGAGMGVNVASVTFTGDEHVGRYDSSAWAERGFCTRCGSNLFYRLKEPNVFVLWLGAFDDQTPFELGGEIFIDEKPDSYEFGGDHDRLTGAQFIASVNAPGDD